MTNGWNVGTLLELMNERDKRYEQRFAAQESAIAAAQRTSETAATVAKETLDEWKRSTNEWRQAMTDREREFLPRNLGYVFAALSAVAVIISLAGKLL